ncbi:hypothetical protein, partial [uncultured Acinetobacter sp.]|uniref:hypothetical protein n=1 Tax=uncultured Acinetobacter sp. TaxID=165433 RepID=UPI00260D898C
YFNEWIEGSSMIISSRAYPTTQNIRALRRIHRAIIRQKIGLADIHRVYSAMLHLERYVDRLDQNKP